MQMYRSSTIYLVVSFINTLSSEKSSCNVMIRNQHRESCWTYEHQMMAPYCDLKDRKLKTIPRNIPNNIDLHVNLAGNKIKIIYRGQLNFTPDCSAICVNSNGLKG